MEPTAGKIAALLLLTLALNIPFGYWRAHAKRKGRRREWFAAIHLPVLLVVLLRILLGLQRELWVLALGVGAFFTGQYMGGRIHGLLEKACVNGTSRMVVRDLLECRRA